MNPGGTNQLICIKGGKISQIGSAILDAHNQSNIAQCVVHVGTNHTSMENPDTVAEKIVTLMKELKVKMPRTAFKFSAILPKYGSSWLPGINEINYRVYRSAESVGFDYIGHNDFACRGFINTELICRDGIHPSYKGVAKFAYDIMH